MMTCLLKKYFYLVFNGQNGCTSRTTVTEWLTSRITVTEWMYQQNYGDRMVDQQNYGDRMDVLAELW
jgi:hypothetical protein